MTHLLNRIIPLMVLCIATLTSCVTEDVEDNTKRGNFEAFWKTIDERYCFFDYKAKQYGLNWNEVRERYLPAISENMTNAQLFEVLSNMTYELRDGHVNLTAAHNVSRYGAWFDDYPMNFSDSLLRKTLGRAEEYRSASGLQYKVLDDNVGYVRCSSFNYAFGDGNLSQMMSHLAACDALIVDIRSNGGGLISSAQNLASLFFNEKTIVGYMSHKTGPGHNDFSSPEAIELTPFKGLRWQKPVAVLVNRRTYSAANCFVMYVKPLPNVTIIGDRTGGGSGMPLSSELPNGWSLRFSACPMYDIEMHDTEMGIDPDIKVDIASEDYQRSIDTILETARKILKNDS